MPSAFIPVSGLPLSAGVVLIAYRHPLTAYPFSQLSFNAPPSQSVGLPKVFMG
jgi:hypothetical protein